MNRGYAGYYKGHFLRSSYEYAYARYLDFSAISWGYEDQTFDLGYKTYKPDFFFYDKHGKISKLVEIKGRNLETKVEALKALVAINERYKIEYELISYEELLKLYKNLPFSLTSIITEWIESDSTTVNKTLSGELNGHYNIRHSDGTKKRIGANTKKLWLSDSVAKQRMLEGLRNSGLAQKGKIKTKREERKCQRCQEVFITLITSEKKFCSQTCSGQHAIEIATETYMKKREAIHIDIKEYIISWTIENKEIVQATPLNKIKTFIRPLTDEIENLFDVKDFRVISKAVFGEDRGRKELIKYMKKLSKDV